MADLNIVIAGAAGQGVQSAADTLGRTLLRLGFHVYTTQDYQSRIRGGHNFMRIRFSDHPLQASVRRADFLLALNAESLTLHLPDLAPTGLALCMEDDRGEATHARIRALPKTVGPAAARSGRFVGVKLLAMLFTILGFPPTTLADAVKTEFGERLKPDVLQANLDAVRDVSAFVERRDIAPLAFKPGPEGQNGRMLVSGNLAMALGMIAAGIGVYAGYPMSPATTFMEYFAGFGREVGIAVEQTEDEISALNTALGAAYAGARAAAGSSGSGISLMAEAIGLAGISETPVVIIDGQRPGPAVGMATRTEQSDLMFVVHASQGEFPRAVIAPTGHDDGFYMAAEAFNIAERWQVPVFLMDDQALADAEATVEAYDLSRVTIDRGPVAPEPGEPEVLKRYLVTESGVSPRAYPLLSKWIVAQDSHEHDEVGHLTDNAANRVRQVNKRMHKLEGIAASFPGPEIIHPEAETLLLCWGSTVGPALEGVELLRAEGYDLGVAIFRYLYPMNKEAVRAALAGDRRLVTLEMNYTGQLGKLLLLETGIATRGHIAKFDGRIITVEDVLARVKEVLGVRDDVQRI
jgi:2-oxoglutarate/2-oxoacid ferredoxin oxidoreductase subunit alpha